MAQLRLMGQAVVMMVFCNLVQLMFKLAHWLLRERILQLVAVVNGALMCKGPLI